MLREYYKRSAHTNYALSHQIWQGLPAFEEKKLKGEIIIGIIREALKKEKKQRADGKYYLVDFSGVNLIENVSSGHSRGMGGKGSAFLIARIAI